MANTDIPWTSFLFIYFGVCEEEIQSGKRGSNSVIGASLSCWFSCSVTFSCSCQPPFFFFLSIKSMLFPLLGNPSKWGYLHTRGNGTNHILAFGILHQSKILPIWAFTRKEKKNILLKKKLDAARIKRVMTNECGYAEGMWGHAPRTVMSVRT